MRRVPAVWMLILGMGCTDEPEIEGLNSLYMGHSYFKRQAEAMDEYAEIAGIIGHESKTLFRGGYNGSAWAIWDDAPSQESIQDHLAVGDTEMFGMTLFVEPEAEEGDGAHIETQVQGIKNWIEFAQAQNQETIFFVALPWLRGPLTYVGETGDPQTSGYEEYELAIETSESTVKTAIMDEIRTEFPDSEIFMLAYGHGASTLRTLYNQGNLPDVDTLVSDNELLGIHSDTHGHAEQMLTDLNTLVWLQSIYGVNVLDFNKEYPYETDINALAYDVADGQDDAYTRQF